MTKPPCKVNGVECQKRYIGCRAECEQYHEWLAKHEAERQNEYNYKHNEATAMIVKTCLKYKERRRRRGKGM